jgi:hypothetical protein
LPFTNDKMKPNIENPPGLIVHLKLGRTLEHSACADPRASGHELSSTQATDESSPLPCLRKNPYRLAIPFPE